ncbi:unnamed protein product [Mortierella alpina]
MTTSVVLIALISCIAGALALPTAEIDNESPDDSYPVVLADYDTAKALEQQWKYVDDTFRLSTPDVNGTDYCLDVDYDSEKFSLDIIVNECNDASYQKWEVQRILNEDNEVFNLVNVILNLCLEACEGSHSNDLQLILADCTEQDNQQWTYIE